MRWGQERRRRARVLGAAAAARVIAFGGRHLGREAAPAVVGAGSQAADHGGVHQLAEADVQRPRRVEALAGRRGLRAVPSANSEHQAFTSATHRAQPEH